MKHTFKVKLHLTKVENFRLKIQQLSIYEIIKEYPKYISYIPDDIDKETAEKCKFDLIEKIILDKTTEIMDTTINKSIKYEKTNTLVARFNKKKNKTKSGRRF